MYSKGPNLYPLGLWEGFRLMQVWTSGYSGFDFDTVIRDYNEPINIESLQSRTRLNSFISTHLNGWLFSIFLITQKLSFKPTTTFSIKSTNSIFHMSTSLSPQSMVY